MRLFRYTMYIEIKFQKCQYFTSIRRNSQEKAKGTVVYLMYTDDSKYEETDDRHEAAKWHRL